MDNLESPLDGQIPFDFMPAEPKLERGVKGTTNTSADGVYGWYRYIQDFTGTFAEQWLEQRFGDAGLIWDPFMGSGTTLVACKRLGIASCGYDVSPFMVDVVRTKTDWSVDPDQILEALACIERDLGSDEEPSTERTVSWADYEPIMDGSTDFPDDKKLRKWMSPSVVRRLTNLVKAVDRVGDPRVRSFLRLGIAGGLVPASNMVLRPNICYRSKPVVDFPVLREFGLRIRRMVSDLRRLDRSNKIAAKPGLGDSRSSGPSVASGIFTSPPYPNDMEYVHQTRLELALLDYVSNRKGLTVLKKAMISSSVKLVYRENEWQKVSALEVKPVSDVFEQLAATLKGKDWGWNAADMVAQYFGGMRAVMRNWKGRLEPGAVAAVVIGDSAFNGVKVATDEILGACAEAEGFDLEDIAVFRTRWNSKHTESLRESVVVLRNRGGVR